eukprot:jgi/Mesen1/1218/ME000129S00315
MAHQQEGHPPQGYQPQYAPQQPQYAPQPVPQANAQPFPGYAIRPPFMPPQPGQVVVSYEIIQPEKVQRPVYGYPQGGMPAGQPPPMYAPPTGAPPPAYK